MVLRRHLHRPPSAQQRPAVPHVEHIQLRAHHQRAREAAPAAARASTGASRRGAFMSESSQCYHCRDQRGSCLRPPVPMYPDSEFAGLPVPHKIRHHCPLAPDSSDSLSCVRAHCVPSLLAPECHDVFILSKQQSSKQAAEKQAAQPVTTGSQAIAGYLCDAAALGHCLRRKCIDHGHGDVVLLL